MMILSCVSVDVQSHGKLGNEFFYGHQHVPHVHHDESDMFDIDDYIL